jgi:hypothetical protein
VQLVKLFKNGEPFKMSSARAPSSPCATWSTQVGPDVTRFVMLTRKNDAPLDFDFDKVLEQSKDNPVFYVQYAHARVPVRAAQGRRGGDRAPPRWRRRICRGWHPRPSWRWRASSPNGRAWSRSRPATHEPHRIAFYLYELASEFHALWNQGNDEPALRFLQEGDRRGHVRRKSRLRCHGVVISAGLGILGVDPGRGDALSRRNPPGAAWRLRQRRRGARAVGADLGPVRDYFEGKRRVVQQAEAGGKHLLPPARRWASPISDARRFCAALLAQAPTASRWS